MPPSSFKKTLPTATATAVKTRLAVGIAIGFIAGILGASYGFVIFSPQKQILNNTPSNTQNNQAVKPGQPRTQLNCPVGTTPSPTVAGVCVCPDGSPAPKIGACLTQAHACAVGVAKLTQGICQCPDGSPAPQDACLTPENTCPPGAVPSPTGGDCLCPDESVATANGCPKLSACNVACNTDYLKCVFAKSPSCATKKDNCNLNCKP